MHFELWHYCIKATNFVNHRVVKKYCQTTLHNNQSEFTTKNIFVIFGYLSEPSKHDTDYGLEYLSLTKIICWPKHVQSIFKFLEPS